MSTDYTETLKKIKDAEESASREILAKKKALEEDLRRTEETSAASIAEAKKKGETLVAEELNKAGNTAHGEADAMTSSTESESKQVAARKLDKAKLKKVIDTIILSEFK